MEVCTSFLKDIEFFNLQIGRWGRFGRGGYFGGQVFFRPWNRSWSMAFPPSGVLRKSDLASDNEGQAAPCSSSELVAIAGERNRRRRHRRRPQISPEPREREPTQKKDKTQSARPVSRVSQTPSLARFHHWAALWEREQERRSTASWKRATNKNPTKATPRE